MSAVGKVFEMLHGMLGSDLDGLAPADKRRYADVCRQWAKVLDRSASADTITPKTGVLAQLAEGMRPD